LLKHWKAKNNDVSEGIEYVVTLLGNDRANQILDKEREAATEIRENRWWRRLGRKACGIIAAIGVMAGYAGDLFKVRTSVVEWLDDGRGKDTTEVVSVGDSAILDSKPPKQISDSLRAERVFEKRWAKQDASGYVFSETFNLRHPECKSCKESEAIPYKGTFALTDQLGRIYEVREQEGGAENAAWTKPAFPNGRSATILNANTFKINPYSWGPTGSINFTAYYEKEIEVCVMNCP
jgi:hypothetical protein